MKMFIMMVVASFVILMGGGLFACGEGSCGSSYSSCGSCGSSSSSCGGSGNDMSCSCVDPSCYWTWEHNCISQSTCCEAFGNIAGSMSDDYDYGYYY
jgi:hypothetical protein